MNHTAVHAVSFALGLGRVLLVGALLGFGITMMPTGPAAKPPAVAAASEAP